MEGAFEVRGGGLDPAAFRVLGFYGPRPFFPFFGDKPLKTKKGTLFFPRFLPGLVGLSIKLLSSLLGHPGTHR